MSNGATTSTRKLDFVGPNANHALQNYDIEMWRYARELNKRSDDPAIGHEHIPTVKPHCSQWTFALMNTACGVLDPVRDQLIGNQYSMIQREPLP